MDAGSVTDKERFAKLLALVPALESKLEEFVSLMGSIPIAQARVFHIDEFKKKDEREILETGEAPYIPVTPLNLQDSLRRAQEIIARTGTPDPSFATRHVTRAPGVLLYGRAQYARFAPLIAEINELKAFFADTYKHMTKDNRFPWLHETYGGLKAPELSRTIPVIVDDISWIGWSWTSKPSCEPMNEMRIASLFKKRYHLVPMDSTGQPLMSASSWQALLQRDEAHIMNLIVSGAKIQRFRELRPSIATNLMTRDGVPINLATSLPVIIGSDQEIDRIDNLPDLDPNRRPQARKKRVERVCLNPFLRLYEVRKIDVK